ncbi:MAG: hypothetical protein R3B39_01240 [Candidatus Paceibacterota bacterium]
MKLKKLGPKIVVITDGPEGAYTFDGQEMLIFQWDQIRASSRKNWCWRLFFKYFYQLWLSGCLLSKPLMWGFNKLMNVVQYVGAQKGLLTRKKLEEWLAKAPTYYKPKRIN